jgi:hypothetical protein
MRSRRPKRRIDKLTPEVAAGIDANLETIQAYLSRLSREVAFNYRPSSLAARYAGTAAKAVGELRTQLSNRLEKDGRNRL